MQALTASEARANLYRLIDEAAESHQPIMISGKRSSAVLLSADRLECDSRDFVFARDAGDARIHRSRHGGTTGAEREGVGVVSCELVFAKQALKDAKKVASTGLKPKAQQAV